jgi:hypothetical protein
MRCVVILNCARQLPTQAACYQECFRNPQRGALVLHFRSKSALLMQLMIGNWRLVTCGILYLSWHTGSPRLTLPLTTLFWYNDGKFQWPNIHNWHTYCRQAQQILLVSSIYATCFDRTGHPHAFKYMAFKTQNKMHICMCLFPVRWIRGEEYRTYNKKKKG